MSVEHDKRIIVYPNYINSKKTVAQGRRIPKELGCENPFAHEMADCCKVLKLQAELEDKSYPRDWLIRGRIRVQLLKADGTPQNPEIPSRRALMVKIAELVPKHPGRHKKQQPAKPEPAAASSSAAAGGSKQSSKTNKKKKK